jgi:hypothetical protein
MESLKQKGLWWDVSSPDQKWYGTIRFDRQKGTRLSVSVPSEKPEWSPVMLSREIVHGLGSDGKLFTLIDCYDGHTRGSLFGVPRPLTIRANALIAGFHSYVADPVLSSVSVSLRHLRDWWGKSGIVTEPSPTFPYFSARYETSQPTALHADETFRVAVRQSARAVTAIFEASIRDSTSIDIEAAQPQPLSEFQRIVAACQDFLSIGCASFCDVDELSLLLPKEGEGARSLGTFHVSPRHRGAHRVSAVASCQLFGPGKDQDKLQKLIAAWLSKDRELFDARTLYREGVYGRGVVEHRLLALTQGVEAFHRRFYAGEYMAADQFEAVVRAPLTAAIPATLEPSHREAIAARLKFANEYSQPKRFTELFDTYSSVLELLVPRPIELVRPIVETRNEFTHFPVPARSVGAHRGRKHSLRVIRYNWVLRLLLESCFMQQMGFSIDEIRSCVSESGTYRRMAEWLRTA